jgi:trehalose 6-phosphate synthase
LQLRTGSTQQHRGAAARGSHRHGLVIVANRLPVRRVHRTGAPRWETSPGGLVSALSSVLRAGGCTWIGWPGTVGATPAAFEFGGVHYAPVALSRHELDTFYEGFSNRSLWPLYHDAVRTPEFHRTWWGPYVEVNRRFAERAAALAAPGATVWVHDYHLQLVPRMLRDLRPDLYVGFFLHIPFPPVELFLQLPWRRQILEGLLGADLVGFQTLLGAQNFVRLARRFHPVGGTDERLRFEGRTVRVGAFPISIDVAHFERLAQSADVVAQATKLRQRFAFSRRILLGVDRLDYTKGIDRRLKAFDTLLTAHPHLAQELVFVQIAVPSRERVSEYAETRSDVEHLVGRINGRHGEAGIVPVHYLYRSLSPEQLVAYYLVADVMVVTPLRDGMNLVAKEYVTCRHDDSGMLVLSEFTGAADELDQALLVNPHDIDGLAAALHEAVRMDPARARRRMAAMRRVVRRHDVERWAANFLHDRPTAGRRGGGTG